MLTNLDLETQLRELRLSLSIQRIGLEDITRSLEFTERLIKQIEDKLDE